jgi:uncharacterized protein YcbX
MQRIEQPGSRHSFTIGTPHRYPKETSLQTRCCGHRILEVKVARLSIAPVKGLALSHPPEIRLDRRGVANDRRFYLIDDDGRLFNGKQSGVIQQIQAAAAEDGSRLSLRFPDGETIEGDVELSDPVETSFYGRPVLGHLVAGEWSRALSEHARKPVRLVRTDEPGAGLDRTHVVSLVSSGSLAEVGRRAGTGPVDGRRFRMTIELEGGSGHEEDGWIGRDLRVGEARIRVVGPVGRCVVTTRNPDTGSVDFDTLGVLAGYRTLREGKSFACGVCGDVLEPGRVAIGDALRPAQAPTAPDSGDDGRAVRADS